MAEIELTNKQDSKIKRAVKALNEVRAELQKDNPDNNINWYLEAGDNFNLMEDESHDECMSTARHDRVIKEYQLKNASGGGW